MHTSRTAAIKAGDRWYYTGVACKRGHLSVRRTDNGDCHQCRNLIRREERAQYKANLAAKEAQVSKTE